MSLKNKVEKMPGYNSLVKPVHYLQAVRAAKKFKYPAKDLRVIAVTGTNGKTTTSWMIWKMLNESGRKCGLLTTVGWGGVGLVDNTSSPASEDVLLTHRSSSMARSATPASLDKVHSEQDLDARVLHQQLEHMTTERVEVLNERMAKIRDAGAEFLVLETTSHALSQSRIYGVPIEVAVFTNLTKEHLDYHRTFEGYRAAKLKLFKRVKCGVINADDENAKYFAEEVKNSRGEIITYGIEQGDVRATEVKLETDGVEYSCGDIRDGKRIKVRTRIPGRFNVYNSLAAVAVGMRIGLTDEEITRGIYALGSVEGRMTRVDAGQDFAVIVDYAHQPDALEKVFESVGHETGFSGRIISLHGGAGRRDHATREPRGEILGRCSDVVMITEDDSRDEDPAEIAQMFVGGAEKAGKKLGEDLFVELDRKKAIRMAINMARKGDLVLILGKGHEKTILRADGAHPFEDIKVVKEMLQSK